MLLQPRELDIQRRPSFTGWSSYRGCGYLWFKIVFSLSVVLLPHAAATNIMTVKLIVNAAFLRFLLVNNPITSYLYWKAGPSASLIDNNYHYQ
ncbi:hypothetical protein DFQ01_101358 [Paenibacillus cellulosilyticus]|uniref:Uncharacterized protein n=1 Tax=Paenibacillus cellulosilyticus TaxID=375489 RepID=A0A2V2Z0P1_9BACL|nr:hypothetical protein DFQ01_101358 [Paenibacillus cellulosilyticus]